MDDERLNALNDALETLEKRVNARDALVRIYFEIDEVLGGQRSTDPQLVLVNVHAAIKRILLG